MSKTPCSENLILNPVITAGTSASIADDSGVDDNDWVIHVNRLEQILNALLSNDQRRRELAELQIQKNQKDSKFLNLLINYACTGTAAVNRAIESNTQSTASLEGAGVEGSPRPMFTNTTTGRDDETTLSPLQSSPSFRASIDPHHDHYNGGGGEAFVDELDGRLDSAVVTPSLSSPDYIARRALSAVVAKRIIRNEWSNSINCCYSKSDKYEIKDILVQHLVNLPVTVRPTIHLIVAFIAYQEGIPDGWPLLIPTLRYLLDQCRHHHRGGGEKYRGDGMGGGRTIIITTAILDLLMIMANPDEPNETLARELLNPDHGVQDGLLFLAQGMKQLNIAQKKEVVTIRAECRRKCIEAFRLSVKGVLDYSQQRSSDIELVLAYLREWCDVIEGLMSEAAQTPTDLDSIQVALASLKCLSSFFVSKCQAIEKIAFPCLRVTVQKCLEVLTVLYPCYENMTINDPDGIAAFEEDAEGGPTSLIVQLCHLLTLCTSRPVLRRDIIDGHVGEILSVMMKYMQITELQKERWMCDANEYLTQEEEYYQLELSVRQSGRELLNALLTVFYRETADDLIQSSITLFEASDENRKKNLSDNETIHWWKLIELAFWVLGLIVEKESFETIQSRPEFEFVVLRIGSAVGNKSGAALLRARALLTATKLSNFLFEKYPYDMDKLLLISAEALHKDEPPPVRVSALKAFSVFLSKCPCDKSEAVMLASNVLEHIADFMAAAEEDCLGLALDVFKQIFTDCPSAIITTEESMISSILAKWQNCSNNPLANVHFLEVFRVACSSSARLRESIFHYSFPSIVKSLTDSAKNPTRVDYQLGISLELYTLLLRETPKPVPDSLWEGFNLVMLVLLRVEEATAIQTACECFALLLIQFEDKIKEQSDIKSLLQVAHRLLSSDLDDNAALMAGPLLQVFIRLFGPSLPVDLVRQIFSAMLRRMIAAKLPALQESIMVVFGCFVCSTSEPMLEVLESISVPFGGGNDSESLSGLFILVTFWIQWLRKVKGVSKSAYVRNVTCSAILSVLEHRREQVLGFSSTENVVAQLITILIQELALIGTQKNQLTRLRRQRLVEESSIIDSVKSESTNAMEAESNREEDWEESLELDSSEDDLSGSETDNSIEEPDTSNLGVFAAEEEKDNLSHVDIKSILFDKLSEMASSNDYAQAFAQVDSTTLELWTHLCQTSTPEIASNSIEG